MDNLIYKKIKITLLLCKRKNKEFNYLRIIHEDFDSGSQLELEKRQSQIVDNQCFVEEKYGIFQSQDNTPYFQSVFKKRGVTIDKRTLGGNRNENRPSEKEMGYGIVLERNVCHNVCRLVIIDRL